MGRVVVWHRAWDRVGRGALDGGVKSWKYPPLATPVTLMEVSILHLARFLIGTPKITLA